MTVGLKPARVLRGERIEARFGENPWEISGLKNLATGQAICRRGTHSLVIRLASRVSDPVFLTRIVAVDESAGGLRISVADETFSCTASLFLTVTPEGLRCEAEVTAPEPVWMAEWKISGLGLRSVVVPALGGQALSKRMPAGTTLSYKYPFWWSAPFILGEAAGGGFWLRSMDARPAFRLARVKRTGGGFDITFGFEADAPLVATTLRAAWYIDCYAGTWRVPVDEYRAWMENAFHLTPLERRTDLPAWVRGISAVLEIWGIGKDSPVPLHTFREMAGRLRAWARIHPPGETLLYLPGFAGKGIDSGAPDYTPAEALGGKEGLRELVALARSMGFRTMLHTNVLAMTFDHPLFGQFKEHQVVDAFGRVQGWGLDIDGDWLAEPYFAYINPGAPAWGDLMVAVIGKLIADYGVDAIFLDQTLLAFNVSRGPNFIAGMREHIRRLRREFPGVLFAGEGLHEQVCEVLPVAQIHGIDSIAEVHGAEGRFPWRSAHPVSARLFGPYTVYTPHLLTRHPSHPMFRLQEAAYRRLGVMPALCLYNREQQMNIPAVRAMLRRAGRPAGRKR